MKHQISSSKVSINRWYPDAESAVEAYERKCKRLGIEPPWNYPGEVAGDLYEKTGTGQRWQGPRDGHGNVYVEVSQ